MDINGTNMQTINRMVNTAWQAGLAWKAPVDIGPLVVDFPGEGSGNLYPWLERTPNFREWIGDRIFNNVKSDGFYVKHRIFEKSESIPATAIKDDMWKVYVPLLGMHATSWIQLKYSLVIGVLVDNALCFDGKALFANDHAYGEYAIDNLTSDALSVSAFEAAILAAGSWQFANGDLVRPNFTHLLHGPKLRSTAFNIVDAERIDDGNGNLISNPNFKRATRVEIPDFVGTADDYWCLVDASGPIKAVARQNREEPVPKMDTDPLHVERSGKIDYMSSGRVAASPTFPHLVYGGRL
ncbi:MAG: Mu-like prophage major head subunit gpT family protein [Kiritimatiellia bacterium]